MIAAAFMRVQVLNNSARAQKPDVSRSVMLEAERGVEVGTLGLGITARRNKFPAACIPRPGVKLDHTQVCCLNRPSAAAGHKE